MQAFFTAIAPLVVRVIDILHTVKSPYFRYSTSLSLGYHRHGTRASKIWLVASPYLCDLAPGELPVHLCQCVLCLSVTHVSRTVFPHSSLSLPCLSPCRRPTPAPFRDKANQIGQVPSFSRSAVSELQASMRSDQTTPRAPAVRCYL